MQSGGVTAGQGTGELARPVAAGAEALTGGRPPWLQGGAEVRRPPYLLRLLHEGARLPSTTGHGAWIFEWCVLNHSSTFLVICPEKLSGFIVTAQKSIIQTQTWAS